LIAHHGNHPALLGIDRLLKLGGIDFLTVHLGHTAAASSKEN
jgi:hypothetical protein